MPRLKDENKIHQIHGAAMKLVIKTGFSALKMADIAREAGIATGTLYIYFSSKEDLINDLFLVTKKEIAEVMFNPNNQAVTIYESFKKMWIAYFKFCFQQPEKMFFVEQFLFSGLITEENIAKTDLMFAPLNQFIDLAITQANIKEMDVEFLKAHTQGSIHEIIKVMIKNKSSLGDVPINEIFELTWNGIRK